jgi:hypothetical protein
MIDRVHEVITIALYLLIFISPVLVSKVVMRNLDAYYLEDRGKNFLDDASDGISSTDYLALSDIVVGLGYNLTVNVTTPDTFYTDAELREYLSSEDIEIIPGTLVEIYMESDEVFLYDSRIFIHESGAL